MAVTAERLIETSIIRITTPSSIIVIRGVGGGGVLRSFVRSFVLRRHVNGPSVTLSISSGLVLSRLVVVSNCDCLVKGVCSFFVAWMDGGKEEMVFQWDEINDLLKMMI